MSMAMQIAVSVLKIIMIAGAGIVASIVVPATALGAIGYGYIRWKGLSFSDFLMYVTKEDIANAISNINSVESVLEAMTATKRHLTKSIENLDKIMDEQVETSKLIYNETKEISDELSRLAYEINLLSGALSRLNDKLMTLEAKQGMIISALRFLCNKADERMILQKAQVVP